MTKGIPFWGPRFCVQPLAAPELRKDPLVERWVLVSTDRLGRPHELIEAAALESSDPCPFCVGNEALTHAPLLTVNDDNGNWRIRIIPNLFPAVRDVGDFVPGPAGLNFGGLGTGLHEVIVEAPEHERSLANLATDQVAAAFGAYAERIRRARADSRWQFPVVFKNSGAAAGASLEHVHSQLVFLPQVPAEIEGELRGCQRYWDTTARCFFCALIAQERNSPRFVLESPRFFVFMPYAGRFPFELCVLPKDHHSHFDRQPPETWAELGEVVVDVLRRLKRGLSDPPYNYVIHTSPLSLADVPHYHWHLEVIPRLNNIGGFEWGTGYNINTVPPEQAATFLRQMAAVR